MIFFFIILTKYRNFDQISEFQPNFRISINFQNVEFQPDLWIFTKFMKWIVTKFQLINDCPCTNFKIIWKAISILNAIAMLPHQTFQNCQKRRFWATLLWSGSGDAAEIFCSQQGNNDQCHGKLYTYRPKVNNKFDSVWSNHLGKAQHTI